MCTKTFVRGKLFKLHTWKGNRNLYQHSVFRWECKCNAVWMWVLTGLALFLIDSFGANMGLGSSLLWDEQREQGQPTLLLKEVAIFPPTIHPLSFAGTSVSLLPRELKQETGKQIWPSKRASATVVPSQVTGRCSTKVGASPGWGSICFPPRQCRCFPASSVSVPPAVWFVFGWRATSLTWDVLGALGTCF